MKPAANLDISTEHGAALRGVDVQPLSKLAARTIEQRADRFNFTDEDHELLKAALADDEDD